MLSSITRFLRDEEGATAIEYGIIAGMMAVILVVVFSPTGTLGGAINGVFARISTALGGAAE
ncbi:Flp family type IVb pilin [Variovorax sp. ZS18.2.2]|uniref:Flp family type IVb pilin n=1 Tax=Variovorax sp. ZS18.2.2 TaxID=2971255 RepID=UPI002151B78F|nr:Flp family type IVb pilin [Variovorax sp. ZS18.2.2]MCR6479705.1 Flp family type IVb pilin [Variovorax sp. ZS18.2.2]